MASFHFPSCAQTFKLVSAVRQACPSCIRQDSGLTVAASGRYDDSTVTWIRAESGAYWVVATLAFLGAAMWESVRARRALSVPVERRWRNHGVLYLATILTSMAVYRTSPILVAEAAKASPYGLLNRAPIPVLVRWVIALLLLDLLRYAVHRASHSVGFLWRLHRVHHSDPDVDVSTGFRNHPLELLVLQGIYLGAVAMLAAPVGAVLAAELAGVFQTFLSHANAHLPKWLDEAVRLVWITPDMHRIHHSQELEEEQSNFGEVFPWWDRLFGTYCAEPAAGQEGLITGLKGLRSARSLDVGFMLTQPFAGQAAPLTDYHRDQSL
jgi:sterol desaturase/sphingolipid hydroxylase (fatty acid hydroxylase superfamily)